MEIVDWPKTQCVYVREQISREQYLVTPEVNEGMEWVFEPGVRAVDKLHGTNGCLHVKNGKLVGITNRKNVISDDPHISIDMDPKERWFIEGFLNGVEKGWWKDCPDGPRFGELVGPKINGNFHHLDKYYFVPFDILLSKFHWKSWISGDYPKDFNTIEQWFKELPSLFTRKYASESSQMYNLAEGLVFWHPDGRRAKLRRDMYSWYYKG